MGEPEQDAAILEKLKAIEGKLGSTLGGSQPGWPEWMAVPTAARYCDCSAGRLHMAIKNDHLIPARPDDGGPRKRRSPEPRLKRGDLDAWMEVGKPSHFLPSMPQEDTMDKRAKLAALRKGERA